MGTPQLWRLPFGMSFSFLITASLKRLSPASALLVFYSVPKYRSPASPRPGVM